jgi:hypothetical protein
MLDFDLALGPAVLFVAIVAGVILLAWTAGRRGLGADFTIELRRDGRVLVRGRVSAGKAGAIRSFFARDLGVRHPVSVRGSFGPGRTLRLQFSGRLTPGQRQQARNFLSELLR